MGSRIITGKRHIPFATGEKVLLFLSQTTQNQYEVISVSGKLPVVGEGSTELFNTAMLRKDDVSDYGYGSTVETTEIISRINQYIATTGRDKQ